MSIHKSVMPGRSVSRLVFLLALGVPVLASLLEALPARAQESLGIVREAGRIAVASGERPLLEYQFAPRPKKPYVGGLYSPKGVQVLRDAPHDHLHHHSLMFAVAVDGVDFWSENERCGSQRDRSVGKTATYQKGGLDWAAFTHQIDWMAPGSEQPMLNESRRIDACRLPKGGPTLLVWRTRLEVPPGNTAATLTGSAYFGLGARFVESMDTGGKFQNADGKQGVAGTNDARSGWCAYSATADGQPVTVAMFDFPANPRHPATWFTMDTPFAYLAATLNLSKEPLVIESGQPLELQYAVALWDQEATGDDVEAVRRWIVDFGPARD
jgi:hypothetical protein